MVGGTAVGFELVGLLVILFGEHQETVDGGTIAHFAREATTFFGLLSKV
jgi:hypothetical protein